MSVTESYLKENYSRYVSGREAGEETKTYEEWRKWFLETFKLTVETNG